MRTYAGLGLGLDLDYYFDLGTSCLTSLGFLACSFFSIITDILFLINGFLLSLFSCLTLLTIVKYFLSAPVFWRNKSLLNLNWSAMYKSLYWITFIYIITIRVATFSRVQVQVLHIWSRARVLLGRTRVQVRVQQVSSPCPSPSPGACGSSPNPSPKERKFPDSNIQGIFHSDDSF